MRYKLAIAAATLGASALLAGCGGDDSQSPPTGSSSSQSSAFNSADVEFAQQMIPHHRQAVMMADLVESHTFDERVKSLATDIEAAQGPEIKVMTGWLEDWGEPVTPDMEDMEGMEGMDHGSGDMDSMPGMMSDQQMSRLEGLAGPKFDRAFLTMMIAHHRGAIEMAQAEQQNGKFAAAIDLADQIAKSQSQEIQTMKSILGS
ncbi:DUF305 domain-containing protein [Solicola gregarius]|uniref:DUF305 domain-containing protein n=1 Tax=Solicola gregarius TaxID=2908642 RepID=A0AA46YKD7_9ACTN|nr:DUF305 domain-containing protein [Solicola gregarius]UYM05655.1 DUF305 domain-containing protein [Solicola gregarius]